LIRRRNPPAREAFIASWAGEHNPDYFNIYVRKNRTISAKS
jgi:hypothetical protein